MYRLYRVMGAMLGLVQVTRMCASLEREGYVEGQGQDSQHRMGQGLNWDHAAVVSL